MTMSTLERIQWYMNEKGMTRDDAYDQVMEDEYYSQRDWIESELDYMEL